MQPKDKIRIHGIALPETISVKGHKYGLSMEYGEHGCEWKCCYKRFFEYSEPNSVLEVYHVDLKKALQMLKKCLSDSAAS